VNSLRQDFTHAVRALAKRPAFTALVVLVLALGIGANSAIFSVVNSVLLKPLPYDRPDELVMIWSKWSNFDKTWLSEAEYLDYREQPQFESVAAFAEFGQATLTGDAEPESVDRAFLTANLFETLGVGLMLGRSFSAEEDVAGGPWVAILAYDLWSRRYGGDPDIVGQTIMVDGGSVPVVGVLTKGFRLPLEFQQASASQIYFPMQFDEANPTRGSHSYHAVARLAPGASSAQATAALATLATRWTEDGLYPVDMQFTAFALPLAEEVTGDIKTPLMILLGAVGLLLLITCANVANILLTRADGRQREIAVRAALGAGKGRLLRLVMTEALVLGMTGGVLGLGLAWAGVRLLAMSAPTIIPRAANLTVDGGVLGLTLVVALASSVLFGAMPALNLSRLSLVGALKDGGHGASDGGQRRKGRAFLVVSEMALAVMLVLGAGLLVRSFIKLTQVDPGLQTKNVLTVQLSLPPTEYPANEDRVQFFEVLRHQVAELPGVIEAGFVRSLPLADNIGDAGFAIQANPVPQGASGRQADWQVATPGYFEAMGLRLVSGRFFDESDHIDGLPVMLLNETLVREYFGDQDPLGQMVGAGGAPTWRTVVGVVGDVRHHGLTQPVKRKWYVPHSQFGSVFGITRRSMHLVVKTAGDPLASVPAIERLVNALDPNLPLTRISTMDSVIGDAVKEQRFTTWLMGGFAALALLLAGVGIYGVIAYSVSSRTNEIGIRLALGADSGMVRRLVIRQGMAPALLGLAIGLSGASLLSHFMTSVLYGISPLDPVTFAAIPVALAGVALLATIVPAHRATRVKPVEALRHE
jgi:putative ABC transport system permease protein